MERIEKTVFISYRRTNAPWALAIFQNLTHNGFDVFLDYDGIASGDFERVIFENIAARAHFLILLTPSALERCNDPGDILRREIETALENQRNIVPLMLEGFDFGTPKIASQLTGKLAELKRYHGRSIPPEFFIEAMDRLRETILNVPMSAVLHPASLSAQRAATEQKASATAAPVVKEEELTAQQWYERGLTATDVDEELRFYSEAIRLKPDYANAFYYRSQANYNKGDLEGAQLDLNKAIQLKPGDADFFFARGYVRGEKRDVRGELLDYNEAIRLKPDHANALTTRGAVRADHGDLKGALLDFNEAIRLDPNSATLFDCRGTVRGDNYDVWGALRDFDEAIRLDPNCVHFFHNRGILRLDVRDVEGALRDFDEAIRLDPNCASAFNSRGNARYRNGDVGGALQDYSDSIRLKPNRGSTYHNRGKTRLFHGEVVGGLKDLYKAYQLGIGSDNEIRVSRQWRRW
jgi:tetratricopeptide (TPR) repeat protein